MNTVDILKKLVSFDTTSHKTNLPLMDFVRDYLARFGVANELFLDATGQKASLFATIGPENGTGIVLSGHTDVVPVTGQAWSGDPFDMWVRDGRAYGRGTTDMKGFLASCLAMVPMAVEADLARPIHLAFSYDEEVGCIGVRPLLDALKDRGFTASLGVVGEPTMMEVINSHKSKIAANVRFTGRAAHSSLTPEGLNALEYAARAVTFIRGIADRHRKQGPFDARFDVPFSTAQVGLFSGGRASNIVPDHAEFNFEFRTLPDPPLEPLVEEVKAFLFGQLLPEMRAEHAEAAISFEEISNIPAFDIADDAPAVILTKRLASSNVDSKVAYGTEAGLFQHVLNLPTIVCGPGSIEQAHKPDEFVDIAQLDKCDRFLSRLLEYACDSRIQAA